MNRRGAMLSMGAALAAGGLAYETWPSSDDYLKAVAQMRRPIAAYPQLLELVRYATLAANSHNTQPWLFRVSTDQVAILPDLLRRTAVVDPDDHHLFVSLGCAAENLLIAAAAQGRAGGLEIPGDASIGINIALGRSEARPTPEFAAIPFRQSTRSVFDGRAVATADIALLEQAAREEGVSVICLMAATQRETVLDFVFQANRVQMNDAAFVDELRHWLRFSPERALATGDGLFGPCSGNPALPEWLGNRLFGLAYTETAEVEKYRSQIRSSAGIAVFVADHADPQHWIRVGRSFQRFALRATALGIRTAHVNQPLEVPQIRAEFTRWLGDVSVRPDLIIRFGRADALPMSARRPVEQVLLG